MEFYPKNKDWESWTGVYWESDEDQPEPPAQPASQTTTPPAEPAKAKPPRYRNFTIREADGSLTYCSVRVSDPVTIDGMMV